jgi:hypothetical protein
MNAALPGVTTTSSSTTAGVTYFWSSLLMVGIPLIYAFFEIFAPLSMHQSPKKTA